MATYGDLDPNAMPDMYHKEYVEPVSGQGLISSLFAGPATPINQVVPNNIRSGIIPVETGANIFAGEPVNPNTGDILSQVPDVVNVQRERVASPNTVAVPPAKMPTFKEIFSDEELGVDMSAPDPKTQNFTQNVSDAISGFVPEGVIKDDPTKSPLANIVNTGGGIVDSGIDALIKGIGGGIKGVKTFITPPGSELEESKKRTDDAVKSMVDAQSGNITDFDYGGTARDIIRSAGNAVTPVANLSREAYGTIEDMINDFRNRNIDYAGMPAQPASPVVDATDATNPVSPNMSTGPSMNLNQTTVANPNAIPILPDQAPGEGRAGTDSIIQSLGLLEMSEAQRAERIAALPEHIRDAVIERVTNIMQSASIGDDIY